MTSSVAAADSTPSTDWDRPFTFLETAHTLLIYVRCIILITIIFVFFLPLSFIFKKPVYDEWLRAASKLFLRFAGVRVIRVVGLEHITPGEAFILTPNHINFLDPFIYQGYFPYLLRGLEKKENFRIPIWGQWMRAVGQIEIDRESPMKAAESMKEVARVLRDEHTSVMVAPEGTRTPNGRLQPFKRGPFKTAADAHVRILPMCCKGLYNVNRKNDWRIKPGNVEIIYGEPLGPPDQAAESQRAISAQLRHWMLTQLGEEETTSQA
ncbi:MAG: 1-acyl-sn-glycerol-3-phosphate acyltransferase [Ignavibacteriae bacterium]|nr:1-acyl-sn-glycerol-3-phosphate acyltransferase [Ignavibacteriota bacterium]